MKIVLVAGTFDGIHPGHLDFFRQARELGDRLVVIVGRDSTVQNVKGHHPVHSEEERLATVRALDIVDEAMLGSMDDPFQTVARIDPDVFALGYDQKAFVDRLDEELRERGCNTQIVRLKAYLPEKHKSSKHNHENHPDIVDA